MIYLLVQSISTLIQLHCLSLVHDVSLLFTPFFLWGTKSLGMWKFMPASLLAQVSWVLIGNRKGQVWEGYKITMMVRDSCIFSCLCYLLRKLIKKLRNLSCSTVYSKAEVCESLQQTKASKIELSGSKRLLENYFESRATVKQL